MSEKTHGTSTAAITRRTICAVPQRPSVGGNQYRWSIRWSASRDASCNHHNLLKILVADAVDVEPVSACHFPF